MKTLAATLLLNVALLAGPMTAGAADTDASAIASFLSIGLANAPTDFSAIRGDIVVSGQYLATNWPDHTHFVSCNAWHINAVPAARIIENYSYSCNSTLRPDTPDALFKMAEQALEANLPSGYARAADSPRSDGSPYQRWARAGSADVKLWAFAKQSQSYYELAIVVPVNP
jgi:hypothetical protein